MRAGVPVMLSLIIGVAAGPSATPGGTQELPGVCDGALSAEEARGCAEQRFDLARGAAAGLAEEQFAAAWPAADGLRQQFGQVDLDGDGWISRDEWMAWFGPAHAEKTNGAGSRRSGTD